MSHEGVTKESRRSHEGVTKESWYRALWVMTHESWIILSHVTPLMTYPWVMSRIMAHNSWIMGHTQWFTSHTQIHCHDNAISCMAVDRNFLFIFVDGSAMSHVARRDAWLMSHDSRLIRHVTHADTLPRRRNLVHGSRRQLPFHRLWWLIDPHLEHGRRVYISPFRTPTGSQFSQVFDRALLTQKWFLS